MSASQLVKASRIDLPELTAREDVGSKIYLGEEDFREDGGQSANRNPVVDAWFEKYDNPQKDLVQAVRALILDTDPRITEVIKWQAPTFVYKATSPRSIRSPSGTCR